MNHALHHNQSTGFTLPELLVTFFIFVVIGSGAILLNRPSSQLAAQHNAERQLDLAMLIQAISKYKLDTGSLPPGITTKPVNISSESGGFDLCHYLVPAYITDIPYDPISGMLAQSGRCDSKDQHYSSGYDINTTADKSVVIVSAPSAEVHKSISLSKHF